MMNTDIFSENVLITELLSNFLEGEITILHNEKFIVLKRVDVHYNTVFKIL
jgi:hypothetical protein